MHVPVTIVIPTLDEADQIAACVGAVGWADEVIVADAGSADETVAAARAAGARVLERTGPTIAAQRNAAIAAARNAWVLALDADERATPELPAELADVLAAPRHAAYRIRRRNFYLGREATRGRWARDWVVRLFPRERRYVERRVHEHVEPIADVGALRATLLHTPYRDLDHQLAKTRHYARLGARDLYDAGRRASAGDLIGRPLARFVRAYVMEGGILEGRRGLVRAALGAHAAFLKYALLWDVEREPGGSRKDGDG